jgi:hypothetical protein
MVQRKHLKRQTYSLILQEVDMLVNRIARWSTQGIPSLVGASEVFWANLAAIVEDKVETKGHVEVDAEDIGLDGGAEAQCGVEVHQPLQQWATLLVLG